MTTLNIYHKVVNSPSHLVFYSKKHNLTFAIHTITLLYVLKKKAMVYSLGGFTALAWSILSTTIPECSQVVFLYKLQEYKFISWRLSLKFIKESAIAMAHTSRIRAWSQEGMAIWAHIGEARNFLARDSANKDYHQF